MAKLLLELSTLDPERPIIEIDGHKYECAVVEDFGILQHTRLERLIRKAQSLRDTPNEETDEDAEIRAQEAEDTCRKAVAMILPTLPAEVLPKLRLSHLLGVLKAYTDFIQAAGITNRLNQPPKSTGAKSRRASKDSTAATPLAG